MNKAHTIAGALVAGVVLGACSSQTKTAEDPPKLGAANPASEYCVDVKKGRLEMQRDAQGNEFAMCHLPDGTVVEEWELYRRENPQ